MLGATFRAWFPAAASAAIAATVALGALARAGGDHLGAPLAPFFATLRPRAGALAAPLPYALGRSLLSEESARTAALLFVFAPSSLLYGATSADALYATLGVAAAAALLARRRLLRVLGPPALAVASFFSAAL